MSVEHNQKDDEGQARLTPEHYQVCRGGGTEPPFSSIYWDCKEAGTYRCVCCGAELFSSGAKFSLQIPVDAGKDLMLKVLIDPLFRLGDNESIISGKKISEYLHLDIETRRLDKTFDKIHINCNGGKTLELKVKQSVGLNSIKLYSKKPM